MRKSNLVSKTIMYSINPVRKDMKGKTKGGEVIVHHLPWSRTSPQLEKYVARGLTFERPQVEAEPTTEEILIARKALDEAPVPEDGRKIEPPLTKKEAEALMKLGMPKGTYYCLKCKKNHRETSKLGKRHLKHKEK